MKAVWFVGAAWVAACGGGAPEAEPLAREPVAVQVTQAWSAAGAASYAARVEATRDIEVATRMSGTLERMPVRVGERVRGGQTLAEIDAADVRARIEAARAQLELAERTQGRIERLAADGAASRQELDEATARLDAARAAWTEASAQAAYVEVTAPFDGVVTARLADPGDLVVPGRPVLRLTGMAVRVVADLPRTAAAVVRPGTAVSVVLAAGERLDATVTRVVPALDPASRRFRVEVDLGGGTALEPGRVVRLEVPGAAAGSLWIPADAVLRRGQLTGVFAVEHDTLRLRWLRLGREVDGAVEVLAGPPGPLTVVRRPGPDLHDGRPVSRATPEAVR